MFAQSSACKWFSTANNVLPRRQRHQLVRQQLARGLVALVLALGVIPSSRRPLLRRLLPIHVQGGSVSTSVDVGFLKSKPRSRLP